MRRFSLKGILLITLPLVFLVLVLVDFRQKGGAFDAPRHLGPGLIAYLEDVPAFWQSAAASPPGQVASDHFSRPLNDLAVAIRKATGIRPTPTRWKVWLGKRAWMHWTPEHVVVALKPGVLLNTYLLVSGWWEDADAAVSPLAGWGMRRHGGMLFFTSRPEWRPEQVDTWDRGASADYPAAAMVYCVLSNGDERWRVGLHPEGSWRLEGVLATPVEAQPVAAQAPLDVAWPMPMIFSVAAADSQGAALLSRMGLDAFGCEDSAPTLFNLLRCVLALRTVDDNAYRMGRAFLEDWLHRAALWEMEAWPLPVFEDTGSRAVALLDIELDGGEAIPVMAMAARTATLDTAEVAGRWPDQFLVNPYQWYGVSGFRIPLLSDIVEFCYAAENERAYAASRESVMELLMARKPSFEGSQAHASVQLDWAALGSAVARDRRALFQAGYFPGEEQMDFEHRFSSIVEGVQRLGSVQLVIESAESGGQNPHLRGSLFQGASP